VQITVTKSTKSHHCHYCYSCHYSNKIEKALSSSLRTVSQSPGHPNLLDILTNAVLWWISAENFLYLCAYGEVILENTYSKLPGQLGPAAAGLKTGTIGYGSHKTWHGTPDVVMHWYEILLISQYWSSRNSWYQ